MDDDRIPKETDTGARSKSYGSTVAKRPKIMENFCEAPSQESLPGPSTVSPQKESSRQHTESSSETNLTKSPSTTENSKPRSDVVAHGGLTQAEVVTDEVEVGAASLLTSKKKEENQSEIQCSGEKPKDTHYGNPDVDERLIKKMKAAHIGSEKEKVVTGAEAEQRPMNPFYYRSDVLQRFDTRSNQRLDTNSNQRLDTRSNQRLVTRSRSHERLPLISPNNNDDDDDDGAHTFECYLRFWNL